jgi:formylglycine-generating enzyme required for sulfatase activity
VPPKPLVSAPTQVARPQPVKPTPPAPRIDPPPPSSHPTQQQAFVIPRVQQPTAPAHAEGGARDCGHCPEMVEIPAGSFQMGSNDDSSEKPVHAVSIAAFAMSRYPVTIGEWKACVAAKACNYEPKGDDNLPVYNVSWNDAQRYVAYLSRATGKKYRLPTEAEWEYAARGHTTSKYWWGNQVEPGKAACKGCGSNYQVDRPMKVGSFAANPFGLYDMTGTVAQWVSDCWHRDYHGAPHNGASWDARGCTHHVLRGGSWRNDASYLRTSSRDSYDTDVRYETHGFRVVRSKGN